MLKPASALALYAVLWPLLGWAQSCEPRNSFCLLKGEKNVGGIIIENVCVSEILFSNCEASNPLPDCGALPELCSQAETVCNEEVAGVCVDTVHTYDCINQPDVFPPDPISTTFVNLQETIDDQCAQIATSECFVGEQEIVEGLQTREINGISLTRAWWKKRGEVHCPTTQSKDECSRFRADPRCTEQASECLATGPDGVCTDWDYHYTCESGIDAQEGFCDTSAVCVGEHCLGIENEQSDDFPEAATWLNIMGEMAQDVAHAPDNYRFFGGDNLSCSHEPGRNCCSEDGILTNIFECSESNQLLANKQRAGATTYVGRRCSRRIFGKCIKRVYHHCAYDSKFARVFMEQANGQLSRWTGNADDANCAGLTVDQLQDLDVTSMELDEAFSEAVDRSDILSSDVFSDFMTTRICEGGIC